MISLSAAVWIIVYILVAGGVFGILWLLINYFESQFPGVPFFFKLARLVLIVLAALVVIGILISLIGGQPIFRP